MSIVRRLLGREERTWGAATLAELIASQRGGVTYSGVSVDHLNALTHDAVWACVNLLVNTVATLPVQATRKKGKVREPLPVQPLIVSSPSALIGREEFIGQVLLSVFENGNAYAVVVDRGNDGFPTQVEIRDHSDVKVSRAGKTGPLSYKVDNVLMAPDDVVHFRGLTRPGSLLGISAINAAKQTIGRGLAAEKYGADWFGQGAHPSSILEAEGAVNEDTAKLLKQRFIDSTRKREPVVMGHGLKYSPIQSDPSKSQLVEIERLITEKTARFFGMPPEMIGGSSSGSSVTYANREQRALDFVTFSVRPWLVRIENPWSALLPRGEFVRFNVEGLLRADTKTRYESHEIAKRAGFASTNDILQLEDKPPITDGERYGSLKDQIEAVGALVRAGFDPAAALAAIGLDPIEHLGLPPVTVQSEDGTPPFASTAATNSSDEGTQES